MRHRNLYRRSLAVLAFGVLLVTGLLAAGALGGSGLALPFGSSGSTGVGTDMNPSFLSVNPTISSNKGDYFPGETVTLTGHGWASSEVVHIFVNDDKGQTWSYSDDVTADATGDFTMQFVLPTSFVSSYSATATGPISGTATTTFTDGNVKVHSSNNIQYDYVYTVYTNSTNCNQSTPLGSVKSTGGDTADSNGKTVPGGVGGSESVRLDAPLHPNAPNAVRVFNAWTSTDPFSIIAGTSNRSICVPGFGGNGTRDYTATYDTPPAVGADNASRTINEGQTVAN